MKEFKLIKLLVLFSLSFSAQAVDIENGKKLHNEGCVRCHDETMYTREDRAINNFDELHKRIRNCEIMTDMTWFDEEIDDVAAYLNQTYYRFNLEK
ncbi:MAG: c-type cytochrome [Gammaproteobacteria bacterium]|jgi:cytochrome c553